MNFDTYKIKDELLEIYSGSEETFCVGKILSKNRDSILFRSYDAQGKNDGLHFIKSSNISEIKSNTQYLRKMQLYLAYWREQEDALTHLRSILHCLGYWHMRWRIRR